MSALDTTTWYAVRATGLTAEAMLLATVIVGLLKTTKVLAGRPRPPWLVDLHRAVGALTLGWTGLHIATLMLDRYVPSGWADIVIPLHQRWHPMAVAAGVVSLWMLVLVQGSSWLQRWLPRRVWVKLHLLALPMTVLAMAHGLTAGADRRALPVLAFDVVGAALVLFLLSFRLLARPASRVPAAPKKPVTPNAGVGAA